MRDDLKPHAAPTEPTPHRRAERWHPMCGLSERELATVLAALRFWQDEMGPHPHAGGGYPEHFDGVVPLDAHGIDSLCEYLNITWDSTHGP